MMGCDKTSSFSPDRLAIVSRFEESRDVPEIRLHRVLLEESMLVRQGRPLFGCIGMIFGRRFDRWRGYRRDGRKLGDRLILQDLVYAQPKSALLGTGHDARGKKRVSAEVEEVLRDRDARSVHAFAEDVREHRLGATARGYVRIAGLRWSVIDHAGFRFG